MQDLVYNYYVEVPLLRTEAEAYETFNEIHALPFNILRIRLFLGCIINGSLIEALPERCTTLSIDVMPNAAEMHLPATSHIKQLYMMNASALRQVTFAYNKQITIVTMSMCKLSSISRTIGNLPSLETFELVRCMLRYVSFDVFDKNPLLKYVNLSGNQITLVDSSRYLRPTMHIETLQLEHNRIRKMDLHTFSRMKNLVALHLHSNGLELLETSRQLHLPMLMSLWLDHNRLQKLDLRNWQMPSLQSLFLEHNQLATVPIGISGLKNLQKISFMDNRLTHIDMSSFSGLQQLCQIFLNFNRLSVVETSHLLQLPNLLNLDIQNNFVTNIDMTRWWFPAIKTLFINKTNLIDQLDIRDQIKNRH